MGVPERLFRPVIEPGTLIDSLAPSVANEVGAGRITGGSPACHDTGSAVVAIPAEGKKLCLAQLWNVVDPGRRGRPTGGE